MQHKLLSVISYFKQFTRKLKGNVPLKQMQQVLYIKMTD